MLDFPSWLRKAELMMGGNENPFWDFSLVVYVRQGVAEACLALQDRDGLDVNLLLLCCWAGTQGLPFEAAQVTRILSAVDGWQRSVVRPLRDVRRWLKGMQATEPERIGALRQAVKDQELLAERIEQDLLYERLGAPAKVDPAPDGAMIAAANLNLYLEAVGLSADAERKSALAVLLCGTFPDLSRTTAIGLIAG